MNIAPIPSFRTADPAGSDPVTNRQPILRSLLILVAALLLMLINFGASAQSVDTGFNPPALGEMYGTTASLDANGKILVAGSYYSPDSYPLFRLNTNGSLDSTFNVSPQPDDEVTHIKALPGGKVLVAGYFNTIGGVSRPHLARLNANGSVDTSFNANVNGWVYAVLPLPDGKVLVGGYFYSIGGVSGNRVVRLNQDGSRDSGFNVVANSSVLSLAAYGDGRILVGGEFTQIQGQSRGGMARLNADGSLDSSFVAGAVDRVYSIHVQHDGKILIGGKFYKVGTTTRELLARLNANGSLDTGFVPPALSGGSEYPWINTIMVQRDGKMLIGGWYPTPVPGDGRHVLRLNANGSYDSSFIHRPDNQVQVILQQADGKSLLAGGFWSINPSGPANVARLNATSTSTQSLSVSTDNKKITWQHGGSSPVLHQAWFEISTDGTNYSLLGAATRTSSGWELGGLTLPENQNLTLRAYGSVDGNGFSSGGGALYRTQITHYITHVHQVTASRTGNGTVSPASQTVNHGANATITVTPQNNHHVASVTGTTCNPLDNGNGTWTAANIGSACAISVQFAINTYTVTFKNWDGTTLKTETVNHGSSATAPASPSRTGYSFTGWDVPFNNVTGPLEVNAQYSINQYTLSFDSQGGSVVAPITQDYAISVTLPSAPSRTGYGFNAWNSAANGSGTAYAPGSSFTMPAQDSTLYAIWTINEYTVTASVSGGQGSITPTSQTVEHGGTAEFVVTPDAGFIVKQVQGDHCSLLDYGPEGWKAQITADCHVSVEFQALADLWAMVGAQSVPTFPGERIVLAINTGNNGPQPATDAQLEWLVPAGLLDVHWTCEATFPAVCPQEQGTGDIEFTLDLPEDGSLLFLIDAEVGSSNSGYIYSQVSIVAGNERDVNPHNNHSAMEVFIVGIFRDGLE